MFESIEVMSIRQKTDVYEKKTYSCSQHTDKNSSDKSWLTSPDLVYMTCFCKDIVTCLEDSFHLQYDAYPYSFQTFREQLLAMNIIQREINRYIKNEEIQIKAPGCAFIKNKLRIVIKIAYAIW